MIKAYRRAVAFLESLPQLAPDRPKGRGAEVGVARTRDLLARLSHPERGLRVLHIGGTSGKGSTVSKLQQIYLAAGYPVLAFTSPHLITTAERICFKGKLVPLETFVAAVAELRDAALAAYESGPHGPPGWFDALFAVGLLCARELGADPVIVEVGLGGRWCNTNQIDTPLVAAVADVGLDHTQILGETLEAIAADKGGIYKRGVPALTSAAKPAAWKTLHQQAVKASAPFQRLGHHFDLCQGEDGWTFSGQDGSLDLGPLNLRGEYDRRNTALAVAAVMAATDRGLAVEPEHIRQGLGQTFAPGRQERVAATPPLILDVAHNPDKLSAFAGYFASRYGPDHTVAFALARDKDLKGCLKALRGRFAHLVIGRPLNGFRRFWLPLEIAAAARGMFETIWLTIDPQSAISEAMAVEGVNGVVAVTGSTFFVGEVRAMWQDEETILQAGGPTALG